jgi:hypothetical protein
MPHDTAIVDYVCTCHFMLVNAPCLNKVKSQNPLTVRLPNGATMESSHTTALDIPELNTAASIAHVFPGMANHSILSVGQLCNEAYTVTFNNASVTICDTQEFQILSGARDLETGLWRINLRKENQQPQQSVTNHVYELRNKGALVNYLHKALFSPTKSALLQAVKNGHLITWPGLMEKAINKHLKLTPATNIKDAKTLGPPRKPQSHQTLKILQQLTQIRARKPILFMPSWSTRGNFTRI